VAGLMLGHEAATDLAPFSVARFGTAGR
jgi:hypothetical protein